MADQGLVEPHPDYTPLCDFVGDTFCGDDSLIVSTIQVLLPKLHLEAPTLPLVVGEC